MSLIRTFAALGSAVSTIMVAYFFGHGLSNGHTTPFVLSGAIAVVALLLVVAQVRLGRDAGPRTH